MLLAIPLRQYFTDDFFDVQSPRSPDVLDFLLPIIIVLFFIILLVRFFISYGAAKKEVLNHWNTLLRGLNYSSKEFYDALHTRMKDESIDGLRLYIDTIAIGGVLSRKRLYLRLSYDDMTYYVCAAPYGKSFFVSYWLHENEKPMAYALSRLPWVGKHILSAFFPVTYYRIDTVNMFHSLVHEHVIELIDEILESKKMDRLSDNQKIPALKNIFDR